ncbi:hypothetical protein [Mucilaginibacter myungsuensis]|uniref:DUF3575 domain-containing protein n=1 Tax=Mucilaginibacter myungsuensis TaxID=649104 RepID=A0A929PUY5_9SPHI|nr:hypothetical protein [Mucilaginibacter myungsuensis]MBE9660426.1 hypothetical protein [Mucilaginibacter myungsuensis]MDN3600468.1 hypothetical protein [Mucilaginibacter myungsuensis]
MKPYTKILFLSLILLGQAKFLFAQKRSVAERNALFEQRRVKLEPAELKNSQIKWSPIRIADPVNPGVELGYERFYAENWSTQISVGYMKDLIRQTPFINYRGNRLSIEQKYFMERGKRKATYLAFEFVLLKADYGYNGTFGYDTATVQKVKYGNYYDVNYTDRYEVDKQTLAFNTKYGWQIPLKNFILDITAGLGVKYRMVSRSGIANPNDGEAKSRHPNVYEMANKEGNTWGISVPVNIKIGYQF